MSGREWKPGDVALVRWKSMDRDRAEVMVRGTTAVDSPCWWGGSGWIGDATAKNVAPVVVIDPESREQVERLLTGYGILVSDRRVAEMQAALREFANPTPPKPEEPTGLGAVVEDAEGRKWIRVAWVHPWCLARPNHRTTSSATLTHGTHVQWGRLDAVKVLSEGWSE